MEIFHKSTTYKISNYKPIPNLTFVFIAKAVPNTGKRSLKKIASELKARFHALCFNSLSALCLVSKSLLSL